MVSCGDRTRSIIITELRSAESSLQHARRQNSYELRTYYEGQVDALHRLLWRLNERQLEK